MRKAISWRELGRLDFDTFCENEAKEAIIRDFLKKYHVAGYYTDTMPSTKSLHYHHYQVKIHDTVLIPLSFFNIEEKKKTVKESGSSLALSLGEDGAVFAVFTSCQLENYRPVARKFVFPIVNTSKLHSPIFIKKLLNYLLAVQNCTSSKDQASALDTLRYKWLTFRYFHTDDKDPKLDLISNISNGFWNWLLYSGLALAILTPIINWAVGD